jgi:NAD(P)-dependent dehydrogenase (short-subunit alcohol dehydrogenase family)
MPERRRAASLFDVRGKTVVLTGATGLLGSRYCEVLAELGAALVMADLTERDPAGRAKQLAADTGGRTLGVACDVGVEADVRALFASAVAAFGRVAVVLNNAAATGELLMRAGDVCA